MTPETLSAWLPHIRDTVIIIIAAFMLLFEVIVRTDPNAYVIGAGLTLLGVPSALRIDAKRSEKREEDPYEGPGGYYRGR